MSYYDNPKEYEARGIDYDLGACLVYNPQGDGIDVITIEKVLAVYEGERDERDWRWVLQLRDGRFVFLQGGCDYTGWDCQSWATHAFADTPELAAEKALGDVPIVGAGPETAGMGHMINLLSGNYGADFQAVRDSLLKQIAAGKDKTWREGKDAEFGLTDTKGEY